MTLVRTFGVSVLVLAASLSISAQSPSLKGVWRVVEFTGADGKVNAKPEPGLYIFTDRHYSIQRVTEPRTAFPDKPTDKDIAAAFGPYTANSGTYQVKGTQLMTQPIVAKNPNVMMGKGQTSEIKMEGANTVYIMSTAQGAKTIVKLQRAE
jgi:hypothetical protein